MGMEICGEVRSGSRGSEYLCDAYYIYKLSPSALDQDDAASHLISIPKRKRSVGWVSPHEASVDYAVSPHFPRSAKIRGCNQKVFHKIIDVACRRDFEAPALVIFRLCRNLVFKIQGLRGFETTDLVTLSACGKAEGSRHANKKMMRPKGESFNLATFLVQPPA